MMHVRIFLGEDAKGVFPHKLINNLFFKDKDILNKTFSLTVDDFYKRDHEKIKTMDLTKFNVGEELNKYGKNDTEITYELYKKLNEISHEMLNTDILRMLTAGMMCHYGLMINLPSECLYKFKNKHKSVIKTKLYLCDKKEMELIANSIYGGRSLPRIHHFRSVDVGKSYKHIIDYLVIFDISGMYVYIMRVHEFPYDKARYATKQELERFNALIKDNKYDELQQILPAFYICDADCQPNEYDLEPGIARHEGKRLIWDCARRTGSYNSIDIKILLRNRGHLYEIKRMLIWEKSCKIFEKWMNITLELKNKGEVEKKPAIRRFAKLSGNGVFGGTLKKDHDNTVQFINSIVDKNKFIEENELDEIIINDEDIEDAYHVFIGKKKSDETKDLTTRSRFLGLFVLSYSRMMLNDIINCIY